MCVLSVTDGEINEQSSQSNTARNLDWKLSPATSTERERSLGGKAGEAGREREEKRKGQT